MHTGPMIMARGLICAAGLFPERSWRAGQLGVAAQGVEVALEVALGRSARKK